MVLYAKTLGASATVLGIIAGMMPLLVIFQIPAASYISRVGFKRFVYAGWGTRVMFIFAIALVPLTGGFLDAKNRLVSDAVKAVVDKAGANPDPGALFGALRPKLDEGRANAQKAVAEAKAVLTAEQWAKLPERIKNPGQQGAGARVPRP